MVLYKKNDNYILIVDRDALGISVTRGKLDDIFSGITEVISKYPTDFPGRNKTFFDACDSATEEGYQKIGRSEIEEQASKILQARKPEKATDEERAFLILKASKFDPFYTSSYYIASEYFFAAGLFDEAIKQLEKALKLDPLNDEYLYQLARVCAKSGNKQKMLDLLSQAILIQKKQAAWHNKKIREPYIVEVHISPSFEAYRNDPDLLKICPTPVDPPKGLTSLYNALIEDNVYQVVKLGEKVLEKYKDKLAVLEPMAEALQLIAKDLDEHGEENLDLYSEGEHTIEYFSNYLKKVKNEIDDLRRVGIKSTVFHDVMSWRS